MVRDIAIFGAGGYGREMASLLKRINKQQQCWNFIGFFDDDVVNKPIGYRNEYGEILGNLEMLNTYPKPLSVILAIGKPKILKAVYEAITNPLIDFPNIVAPEAHILDIDNFSMGKGNILGSFSSMSCNVHIGDFNIFNNIFFCFFRQMIYFIICFFNFFYHENEAIFHCLNDLDIFGMIHQKIYI